MKRPDNTTEFQIYGIVPYDRINGSYSLILKDIEGIGSMVSIIIGSAEAQSIAIFLEGTEIDASLTHDLFCNFLMDRSIDVEYVVIDDSNESTYFANIVFSDGFISDCRPSDGISIAIRLGSPIYIDNEIVDLMSFEYKNVKRTQEDSQEDIEKEDKDSMISNKKQSRRAVQSKSDDLEKQLTDAIENEDYELAAKIRDLINASM